MSEGAPRELGMVKVRSRVEDGGGEEGSIWVVWEVGGTQSQALMVSWQC